MYRKIKKRQRDRAGDGQLEDDELGEAAARKRAEERMSLRHKVCECFFLFAEMKQAIPLPSNRKLQNTPEYCVFGANVQQYKRTPLSLETSSY